MLELFENLSKSLDNAYNEETTISVLRDFFIKNFKITNLSIYIYDEKHKILKDFAKEWSKIDINDKTADKKLLDYFTLLADTKVIISNNELKYGLYRQNKCWGFLKFTGITYENLIEFLKLATFIISLKIQNILLAESMQKNIDFHELIRNIAKIIETQYELNYIIPLIGEMLDKFMTNCLIYIFVKNEGKFELLWPANCNDKNIINTINIPFEKDECRIIANGKTGIFPLVNENKILGCIAAKNMELEELDDTDINYLKQLAKQSSATINRANVYAEILKHATLDALTGFYNRRQLEERIKQETSKAKRQKTPLCAIMIDIDFFKRINDLYGHAAGDLVLKTVSKTMRSQLREYDIAGRYGGEEFAILLPFTRTEEAIMVAERLRQSVENKKIDLSKVNQQIQNKIINATISLGIYEFKDSNTAQDLLKNADMALYKAKETGRNKVVVKIDEQQYL